MASIDPLRTFHRRAYRHTLEDGVADIVVGFYTITVGAATQRRTLLALAVAYLLVYAMAWRWLHHRLSSSRIGYAEVPDQPPRVLLTGALAAGVLTLIVIAVVTLSAGKLWGLTRWPDWAPILAGLVLGAGFLQTALRSGLRRYYGYVGVALVGSAFFWRFPFGPIINPSDRLTLFLFVVGAVMALAGTVVAVRFKQAHPVLKVEGSDDR